MGQFPSRPTEYSDKFIENRAFELYKQFETAVQEDDRVVQKKLVREMEHLVDMIINAYRSQIPIEFGVDTLSMYEKLLEKLDEHDDVQEIFDNL